jgi:hypothetical protein
MKLYTFAIVALSAVLAGCGAQSATPPSYPASAAPATVVIADTDLGNIQLSVQDGDEVIAVMQGGHYTKVSLRPGAHTFSAGTGARSLGGGTVQVDVQPGQVIYLQVGGASSTTNMPAVPGYATGVGRAEGSIGVGGISQIPQSSAEYLMKQSAEQQPMPPS